MSYSRAYRARIVAEAHKNPTMTGPELRAAVKPEPGESPAPVKSIYVWIQAVPGRQIRAHAFWTEERRAEAVHLMLTERWAINRVILHFRDNHGMKPRPQTLLNLLPDGADYQPEARSFNVDDRYPAHIRALAMDLVIGGGYSVTHASKTIRKQHGYAPAPEVIARWTNRHPAATESEPDPDRINGDSWQRAWDAAEGRTGAAWAETVMRHWLPDIERNSDEQRMQKAETRRRKRKEAREQTESAPSRRLAA